MIKLFFITFFMAELIIATAIISKICKFNRYVNYWNTLFLKSKTKIRNGFIDLCLLFEDFSNDIYKIKEIIRQKRFDYLVNFLRTSIIYCGIFLLRGKYKKAILTYQVAKEIYEGLNEA